MRVSNFARVVGAVAVAVVVPGGLSGCIVGEIRDELHAANQRLGEADSMMIQTSQRLEAANERMDVANERMETANERIARTQVMIGEMQAVVAQTNTQLAQVQVQLDAVHGTLRQTDERVGSVTGVLGQTNPQLVTANEGIERLRILQDMQATLKNIDASLVPLYKTMSSLGSTMSFFGLGGEEETPPSAPSTPPSSSTPVAAAPVGGTPESAQAPAEARPVVGVTGTWILVHPLPATGAGAGTSGASAGTGVRPARVLVMLAEGRYLEGDEGRVRSTGKWVREGGKLTLTPEAGVAAGGTGGSGTTGAGGKGGPGGATFDVVSLTTRALTVRSGDDFRVYARP